MIQWLYKYIFRGIGVLVVGMITALLLALASHRRKTLIRTPPAEAPSQRK